LYVNAVRPVAGVYLYSRIFNC